MGYLRLPGGRLRVLADDGSDGSWRTGVGLSLCLGCWMIHRSLFHWGQLQPCCVIASAGHWKVCPVKSGITMPPVVCSFGAATSRLTLGRSTPAASGWDSVQITVRLSGGPGISAVVPSSSPTRRMAMVATRCCSPVTLEWRRVEGPAIGERTCHSRRTVVPATGIG